MKIVRNGVEIELTPAEVREAHDEYSKQCRNEDILSKLKERLEKRLEKDVDSQILINLVNDLEENINIALIEKVENALSKNDGYYESYWSTIDYVLDEELKEMK